MSDQDPKQAIVALMRDFSIEATPHDAERLDEIAETLPPGTSVYMAHPPGVPIEDIVALAARLQKLGMQATPHIIARKLTSEAQLEGALASLQEAGVTQALVVGGDIAADPQAFEGSLEVLKTGLFGKYGFKRVGVAGHPEGSKAIGEPRVTQALEGKAAFAKDAGFDIYIATQFGFDPQAFIDWESATTAAGVTLPIHVGVAGPASLRQLARFAMLCGVGASARMLTSRTGAMANLLRTQAPDDMITALARHRAAHPGCRMQKLHFFAFGGVLKSARWARAVLEGQFELNAKATGFEVAS